MGENLQLPGSYRLVCGGGPLTLVAESKDLAQLNPIPRGAVRTATVNKFGLC